MPISQAEWHSIARRLTASLSRRSGLSRDDCEGYAHLGMVIAARQFTPGKSHNTLNYMLIQGLRRARDEMMRTHEIFRKHGLMRDMPTDFPKADSWTSLSYMPDLAEDATEDIDAILSARLAGDLLAAVRLWLFGGWPLGRIAKAIGMSESNVWLTVERGLTLTRYELGRYLLGLNHSRRRSSDPRVLAMDAVHGTGRTINRRCRAATCGSNSDRTGRYGDSQTTRRAEVNG